MIQSIVNELPGTLYPPAKHGLLVCFADRQEPRLGLHVTQRVGKDLTRKPHTPWLFHRVRKDKALRKYSIEEDFPIINSL